MNITRKVQNEEDRRKCLVDVFWCGIDLLSGKCSSIRESGVLSKQATHAQLPDLLASYNHRDL